MKGMIVYSFAWRRNGHSPCNVQLARAASRYLNSQSEEVIIFAQRTTAAVLNELGVPCNVVKKTPGYEGSEQPTLQAAEVFRANGVTHVIPVAHPFLHLTKCMQLVRKEGFQTPSFLELLRIIGWIDFDKQSVQPWTRGPIRLLVYTIRQKLFGYRPPPEFSE